MIVCGLFSALLNFTPLLRFSFTTLLYGLLGGVICVVSEVGYVYYANRNIKRWSPEAYFSKRTADTVTLSRALIQSAGEETFFRGFIFVPLTSSFSFFGSTIIALIINALISIGIYSTREKIDYFKGIQATILGIIYLSTYSIFAVIVARFIGEVSLILASHFKLPHFLSRRFSYVTKQAV